MKKYQQFIIAALTLSTFCCFQSNLDCAFGQGAAADQKPAVEGASERATGLQMADAAAAFVRSLPAEQQKLVQYSYDHAERVNWHFIPRDRNGVGLWDLNGDPRKAGEALVKAGLSAAGYQKTLQVRSLEEVLYLFEEGEEEYRRQRRHPHRYYITIFGTPGEKGLWGWRFEGHHLCLNFSIRDGEIVSSTPEFLGANPGVIEGGPGRSLRVLGKREDLAREILKACSDEQKKMMWIDKAAPDDVRGGGVVQPVVTEAVGLPFGKMSVEQQSLFRELLGEYVSSMPAEVVRDRMKAIEEGGLDNVRIAWWGSSERNERHHYVIQGKSFIVEYNNTQNEANHVHAMWRNLGGDFNLSAGGE
ncbi:MAG: DUF3500 domain-containing protein [Planctomyces sp.]|nr:DUF3500 domain-containing protein [Planctomyces sp.]